MPLYELLISTGGECKGKLLKNTCPVFPKDATKEETQNMLTVFDAIANEIETINITDLIKIEIAEMKAMLDANAGVKLNENK